MDRNELIDRITKEVLARLKSGADNSDGEKTTPASSQVYAPAAAGAPENTSGAASAARALLPAEVAPYIDHTLLKPDATRAQIDKLCEEAAKYHFCSVCVNTTWVDYCARKLRGTGVKVCTVVGFPLGAMDGRSKGFEARHAIEEGAAEIDMVINVGALKSGDLKRVEEDIRWVLRACRPAIVTKVIIETALLTDEEKVMACQVAKKAGVDFVKTSTGFARAGATPEDVALMRRTVGPKMGVKAAGGVRSLEDARKMIEAGATRLGTSSGVAIVTGGESKTRY